MTGTPAACGRPEAAGERGARRRGKEQSFHGVRLLCSSKESQSSGSVAAVLLGQAVGQADQPFGAGEDRHLARPSRPG